MNADATILLIDDDQDGRYVLKKVIERCGYTVAVAADGRAGLNLVEQAKPDVILVDAMMPVMNGFEVAERLRSNGETRIIPLLMITGLQDVDTKIKALEAGVDDVLTKPVNALELHAKLKSMVKVKAYNDHMLNYQAQLKHEVERATKDLRDALYRLKTSSLVTISRLAAAAEYKDKYTGRHLERVSYSAAAIARRLGLDDHMVENIMYASPMHDIGKIGIPDSILLKPGKLDAAEWEIMKKHTVIGADLLKHSNSDIINLGEEIARSHHERWDGTGYPGGLQGEAIPLAGRITAIIDVFDALCSERPYKAAFSYDKSFKIIEQDIGSHFDPDIGAAALAERESLIAISEHYR